MQRSQSETPLSDLIDDYVGWYTHKSFVRFLQAFREARVGVGAIGIPPSTIGDFQASSEHPISVGSSEDDQGNRVVLVCADPHAFAQRFGLRFNAEMQGRSVLETVLHDPECAGIRVNSAIREVSIIIDRENTKRLLAPSRSADQRPWWRLW